MKNNSLIRKESPFEGFLDKFFDNDYDFFRFPKSSNIGQSNIIENENDYLIEVSVPGFKKEDIKIDLEDGILSISSDDENLIEDTNEGYYRKEFSKLSFSRKFRVPDDIDISKINAKMEDGILNITVPKIDEEVKEKLKIKIK